MRNTGIHHISVMLSDVKTGYRFYHEILGMKLILNTVNQDEHTMYHLFFGDQEGRPGTEFTIFDMGPEFKKNQFGTNAIERTYFLLGSEESLYYWQERLESFDVCHYGIEEVQGKKQLRFEDQDGQKLGFVYDDTLDLSLLKPYHPDDIEVQHAILGIGRVDFRVRYPEATAEILEQHFGFEHKGNYEWNHYEVQVFAFDNAFHHQVHIIVDKTSPVQRLGVGGIHHIAFGVESQSDLLELQEYLQSRNKWNSGIVYREFFYATYFREPNYILFEVATPLDKERETFPDQDLTYDALPLDLPDFLEPERESIERNLGR